MDDITLIKDHEIGIFSLKEVEESIVWHSELTHKETGQKIKLKRSMAYCAYSEAVYYYDKFELPVQPFTMRLEHIRWLISKELGVAFNSVLLNKYKDGRDKINWHSDKEDQLGDNPVIACANFGATRQFRFLNKETGEKSSYPVAHGSLLIMRPECQKRYLHAILPEKDVKEPRISLTFRRVIQ